MKCYDDEKTVEVKKAIPRQLGKDDKIENEAMYEVLKEELAEIERRKEHKGSECELEKENVD